MGGLPTSLRVRHVSLADRRLFVLLRQAAILSLAAGSSVAVLWVFVHYAAVASWGHDAPLIMSGMFLGVAMAAVLVGLLVGLAAMVPSRSRRSGSVVILSTVVFLACFAVGDRAALAVRTGAFRDLATRLEAVIEAVGRFEAVHHRLPRDLSELVPHFLPDAPSTGMGGYPKLRYESGDETRRGFFGNSWVLYLNCPSAPINFDTFIYLPLQNYPGRGLGGYLEKLGRWAYVHE